MKVDLNKIKKVASRQFLNSNDYTNLVPAISVTMIREGESENIPLDARTYAIRCLKNGNHEINEE